MLCCWKSQFFRGRLNLASPRYIGIKKYVGIKRVNLGNNYFSTIFDFLEPTTPIWYPYRALGMILSKKKLKKNCRLGGSNLWPALYTNCGQISKHTMKIRYKIAFMIFCYGFRGHFETFLRTAWNRWFWRCWIFWRKGCIRKSYKSFCA